jgi:hypothetical protein
VVLGDFILQEPIGGRIALVQGRADDRDRATTSFNRRSVCSGVNALGQTADNNDPLGNQNLHKIGRALQTSLARTPGPDDGDPGMTSEQAYITSHMKLRRGMDSFPFIKPT